MSWIRKIVATNIDLTEQLLHTKMKSLANQLKQL